MDKGEKIKVGGKYNVNGRVVTVVRVDSHVFYKEARWPDDEQNLTVELFRVIAEKMEGTI